MTFLTTSLFVGCPSKVAVCISLFLLRKKKPDMERPFKMWGYPVTAVLATVITLILVLSVSPKEMMMGAGLMLSSIPAYFIFLKTTGKKDEKVIESEIN